MIPSLFAIYDPTISLGTILSAVGIMLTIVGAAWSVAVKVNRDLALFQQALQEHTKLLEAHAKRIDNQDKMILDVIRSLERLLGRLEATPRLLPVQETR